MNRFVMVGALGRMGKTIVEMAEKNRLAMLTAAVEREEHPLQGKNISAQLGIYEREIFLTSFGRKADDSLLQSGDAFIDFSSPQAGLKMLETAARLQKPAVIGTTGWTDAQRAQVQEHAQKIPVVLSSNMSVGVNALFVLTRLAAKMLVTRGYDPEILEIHHNKKKDAPSGTAKTLESIVLGETAWEQKKVLYGREGMLGERDRHELGVMSLRGGDVTGEHCVYFFGEGERIELRHLATSREIFAQGALLALNFVCQKAKENSCGLFSMQDILQDLLT